MSLWNTHKIAEILEYLEPIMKSLILQLDLFGSRNAAKLTRKAFPKLEVLHCIVSSQSSKPRNVLNLLAGR